MTQQQSEHTAVATPPPAARELDPDAPTADPGMPPSLKPRVERPEGCGLSCRHCPDYFTCRLPGCPQCPNRRWRRSAKALDRLHADLLERAGR